MKQQLKGRYEPYLLPLCFWYFEKVWRVAVVAAICSVGIEVLQGVLRIGYAEVDDVLNNVIGTMIGGYWMGVKMRKNVSNKSHFKS